MDLPAPANSYELDPRDRKRVTPSILSGEINTGSIRALEEQIAEHERTIIKLKRARNSLLNISTLPPEVLGDIFRWIVTPEGIFDGIEKGSYNFLLVCHHWFEVASCTPEIWSCWGNNLQDWTKRHPLHPAAPLDLVLNGMRFKEDILEDTLRKALQDRGTRDTIRRIHLISEDSELLSSIISLFTASSEGLRSSSMESLILWDNGGGLVDVSGLFAHYRFPKLQRLKFVNCTISSWDTLTSRTSALTTLDLHLNDLSPIPTTSQLLLLLASNPTLRKVALAGRTVPDYHGDRSTFPVPLRHLKELRLSGGLRNVVGLLHELDHPRNTDLRLNLQGRTVRDISRILGPCLRDYLQRRDRSQNGLGLYVSRFGHEITLRMGNVGGIHPSTPESERMVSFMGIIICVDQLPPENLLERAILDLIPDTAQAEIVYFKTYRGPAMNGTYAQFPNLRALHFDTIPLSAVLPEPNLGWDGGVLPFLQYLSLERVVADGGDWGPLVTFLSHRASSGNQLDSLAIVLSSFTRPEVQDGIRSVVRELRIDRLSSS